MMGCRTICDGYGKSRLDLHAILVELMYIGEHSDVSIGSVVFLWVLRLDYLR